MKKNACHFGEWLLLHAWRRQMCLYEKYGQAIAAIANYRFSSLHCV